MTLFCLEISVVMTFTQIIGNKWTPLRLSGWLCALKGLKIIHLSKWILIPPPRALTELCLTIQRSYNSNSFRHNYHISNGRNITTLGGVSDNDGLWQGGDLIYKTFCQKLLDKPRVGSHWHVHTVFPNVWTPMAMGGIPFASLCIKD